MDRALGACGLDSLFTQYDRLCLYPFYFSACQNRAFCGAFAATTASGNNQLTGLTQAQTNQLTIGMAVTGAGIPANTVITGISPGFSVTMNNNATATATNVAVTFSPTLTIEGIGQGLL